MNKQELELQVAELHYKYDLLVFKIPAGYWIKGVDQDGTIIFTDYALLNFDEDTLALLIDKYNGEIEAGIYD